MRPTKLTPTLKERGWYIGTESGLVLSPEEYEAWPIIPGSGGIPGPMIIRKHEISSRRKAHSITANQGIISDIEPYKSVITGERIAGRKQHRDHLKAHHCVETGNDFGKQTREEMSPVMPDIIRAIENPMNSEQIRNAIQERTNGRG